MPVAVAVSDAMYPGTAVARLQRVVANAKTLTVADLSADWDTVRRCILAAGGLKDITDAAPGNGYTGHAFNDYNHCDLTTMRLDFADEDNQGRVNMIAHNNPLGNGIRIASDQSLGPGGSWSTCMMGCNTEPPQDVAHVQFQSRIAFKLVWCPPSFSRLVLVDESGRLLAHGEPSGGLPSLRQRSMNYELVRGSKYAVEAERIADVEGAT